MRPLVTFKKGEMAKKGVDEMARNKDIPIVEEARKLATRRDDRIVDLQKAVKKQQERDIKRGMKTHRA